VRPQPDSLHRISVRTLVLAAAAPDPFKPGVPGLTLTQTWLVLSPVDRLRLTDHLISSSDEGFVVPRGQAGVTPGY
jgi:hypothetical protein